MFLCTDNIYNIHFLYIILWYYNIQRVWFNQRLYYLAKLLEIGCTCVDHAWLEYFYVKITLRFVVHISDKFYEHRNQ